MRGVAFPVLVFASVISTSAFPQETVQWSDIDCSATKLTVPPAFKCRTTQAYSGDGAYAVKGNTLVFTEDRGNTRSGVAQFRVEQISKDGQTWTDQFCMTKSDVPDVCYKRTR